MKAGGLRSRALACLLLIPLLARGDERGLDHLLLGAEAFRKGDFSAALVEFRVAEAQNPTSEAGWYAAAALVKLHRPDEALEAFAQAEQRAPAARDVLFDFYESLACYDARLYGRAATLLARIGPEAGPHLAEQAAKLRAQLRPVLAEPVTPTATEWYQAEATRQRASGRTAAAALFDAEAAALVARAKSSADGGPAALLENRQ